MQIEPSCNWGWGLHGLPRVARGGPGLDARIARVMRGTRLFSCFEEGLPGLCLGLTGVVGFGWQLPRGHLAWLQLRLGSHLVSIYNSCFGEVFVLCWHVL